MTDAPTPAPEPVELAAEELAAAEAFMRPVGGRWVPQGVCALVMAEYDRRGILLAALMDGQARADLARALLVVEAAGRVMDAYSGSDLDDNSDHPLWNRLDDLARAVRAAREPRTGEQG